MTRGDDIRMLREALELDTLNADTRTAFADMLRTLMNDDFGRVRKLMGRTLTEAQRAWVSRVLDVPVYTNDISEGRVSKKVRHNHKELAECTASCPAWKPPTLKNLPKRPPTRSGA